MEKIIRRKMMFIKSELFTGIKDLILIVLFGICTGTSYSQEQRLTDYNTIGWLTYIGTFKIKPKMTLYTELQWRRVDGIKNGQQNLIRTGVNFAVRNDISLNAGYAFGETFTYGDYPSAFAFPEHRIYEQVVIKNPIGNIDISHRFTLEQRFIGQVVLQNGEKNTDYSFLNRMRYRLRSEVPISKNIAANNSWSILFYNEIFIGWGRQVGTNTFDQNRLAILLGYRLNQNIKFEAGYLNQILQQGKRINDRAVFQYNNGFMFSTNIAIGTI